MKVVDLKTNRMTCPLGYQFDKPRFSFIAEETEATSLSAMRIQVALDPDMQQIVYDSGKIAAVNSISFEPELELSPCTRYYWHVWAKADNGDEAKSAVAWFETAKRDQPWQADWITPLFDKDIHPIIFRDLEVDESIKTIRIYGVGLGVYELYWDDVKVGDEYLLPGLHAYDCWIQYQTYEIKEPKSGRHRLSFMLGNGWYKGKFGLKRETEIYGDRMACLAEIHLIDNRGQRTVIGTDTTWQATRSPVLSSGIYDGEERDATLDLSEIFGVQIIDLGTKRLKERLSPPICIHERIKPIEVIHTPAGETVLDMGQNMVGWLEFRTRAERGQKLVFQFGEILQDGNFYRENLREAKACFTYLADGRDTVVRPQFTFFGFRYVKVEGQEEPLNPDDYTGCVIHSSMDEIGSIETSDPLVNRLIDNARWSQKGNFLDVPTDCPQRDERMGWTGDAQIFCGTACFNMDTYAFYTKYCQDLAYEQAKFNGSVPHVVPLAGYDGHGSTAWGDAATVIPFEVYVHFGDKNILKRQYDSMKAWVDYILREDNRTGNQRLWTTGYHFADWLALDGKVKGGVYGGTDPYYIASAYYFWSADRVAKAAQVLEKTEDALFYRKLAHEIRHAIRKEYFTPTGRLSVDTQTGHALALYMGLAEEAARPRVAAALAEKIRANGYHLDTGFVGTPYLCRALSAYGYHDLACTLLFNKDYPGWLYEVLMGATTIWERWNSVLPDGKISSTGMNSLNHYAYGSIVEWIYRFVVGINPDETLTGFARTLIKPGPDYRFSRVKGQVKTPFGLYRVEWRLSDNQLELTVSVPIGSEALLILPDAFAGQIEIKSKSKLSMQQDGTDVKTELKAGSYRFFYPLTKPYRKIYSVQCLVSELMEHPKARETVIRHFPMILEPIPFAEESTRLIEILRSPFVRVPEETIKALDADLQEVT